MTAGPRLFGRQLSCTIGTASASWNDQGKNGLKVDGFDIRARIQRNLIGRQPNTAHVFVFNMSEDTRQILSGGSGTVIPVQLDAGYQGASSTIFRGTARYAWTDREGPDNIMQFQSGDLEEAMLSRGAAPAVAKVPILDALTGLANAMGAGKGNIAQALTQLGSAAAQTFRSGALLGSAPDQMNTICQSAGLEWSIQNGQVQLSRLGESHAPDQIYDVSSDSGLVGSPNVDTKGLLKFRTLLLPGLAPGNLVRMNARYVQGVYRVERCTWDLSTFETQWYQDCEGMKVAA